MKDRAFAVSTVMMITWIVLWILAYRVDMWQKIPVVADLFPLPLPNGNLSYYDAVTSIGIIGTLLLGLMMGYYATKIARTEARGFHVS